MAPHGHRVQAFVCGDRADLCRRQASGVNIRGGAASLQVPDRVIKGEHPLVAAVGTRTCAADRPAGQTSGAARRPYRCPAGLFRGNIRWSRRWERGLAPQTGQRGKHPGRRGVPTGARQGYSGETSVGRGGGNADLRRYAPGTIPFLVVTLHNRAAMHEKSPDLDYQTSSLNSWHLPAEVRPKERFDGLEGQRRTVAYVLRAAIACAAHDDRAGWPFVEIVAIEEAVSQSPDQIEGHIIRPVTHPVSRTCAVRLPSCIAPLKFSLAIFCPGCILVTFVAGAA